ncbi:hypothetical protein M569_08348, partial [Genlisea aurea]
IWELPPQAKVLARSKRTGVEMFSYANHILGIQGHPEYTKGILLHLVDRLSAKDIIKVPVAEEIKKKMDAVEPDKEAWGKLCRSFLKGRL